MKFLSLQPFIPSGNNFEKSKELFLELGFSIRWDAGGYIGFERDATRFILQEYDNREFAENLMISVGVEDVEAYREFLQEKKLAEKFSIRIGVVTEQPYGKEMNVIDLAGVCWHFVEG